MYQYHQGIAGSRLTSPFPNLYCVEFEGALNVESFITPPYSLIQHARKCKSYQELPINELRSGILYPKNVPIIMASLNHLTVNAIVPWKKNSFHRFWK